MQAASSIYIREDLKTQLNNLKRNPKESYNDVIERLVNRTIDDEPLSADAIKGLEEGLNDIKKGNLISVRSTSDVGGIGFYKIACVCCQSDQAAGKNAGSAAIGGMASGGGRTGSGAPANTPCCHCRPAIGGYVATTDSRGLGNICGRSRGYRR